MAENLPYEKFFKDLVELDKKQREIRKNQGINDYNILTSVLSEHDEVRLHSRMIASFLDSQGEHYRDSLFFNLFMETLGLADFGIDSTNLEVITEYNNIDIYITDGARHIIIENKIHASDGEVQIQRYVAKIYEENEGLRSTNLLVLYLSIDRASPSQTSLGNLTIQPDARRDKLMEGDKFKAYFKNINYATHILPWLEQCQKKMKDIPNLSEAFKQYAQVVRNITNTNERTKMTLAEIFNSNPEYYEVAQKLIEAMSDFKAEKVREFIAKTKEKLDAALEQTQWECILDTEKYDKSNQPHLIIKNKNLQKQAVLALSFEDKDYHLAFYGIIIIDPHNSHKTINLKKEGLHDAAVIENARKKEGIDYKDENWVIWEYCAEGDFIQYILTNRQACANLARWIQTYLDDHKDLIDKINALIKKHHK